MAIHGFTYASCVVSRVVGEYTCRHYDSLPSVLRCVYCGGECRHYPGVLARAAEDSHGGRNAFHASRVPADVRVLRCEQCLEKWSTRMTDAELRAALAEGGQ